MMLEPTDTVGPSFLHKQTHYTCHIDQSMFQSPVVPETPAVLAHACYNNVLIFKASDSITTGLSNHS